MNDNPAACNAVWLASEIIPASATTVTSVRSWAVLKALMTGSMVAVSALLPSNAATVSGNPEGWRREGLTAVYRGNMNSLVRQSIARNHRGE